MSRVWYNKVMKKGTSTKPEKPAEEIVQPQVELQVEPNEKLLQFIEQNNLDFQVSVFTDNYVYVEGQGFLFFDKPQLIYKAKVK